MYLVIRLGTFNAEGFYTVGPVSMDFHDYEKFGISGYNTFHFISQVLITYYMIINNI